MANEPGAPAPSGTDPNAQPPGGAPPPIQLPLPSAAPPPAPRAPQRPAGRNQPAPVPFDQHPGFKKRLRQEAAREIQRKLGCTLEEAIAKLAAATPAPGAAPAPGAPPAAAPNAAAIAATAVELAEKDARIKKLKTKLARRKSSHEAQLTRLQLENAAIAAGVPKQYTNFALAEYESLFGIHAVDPTKVPAEVKKAFDREPEMDDAAVFAYVRKTHMPSAAPPPAPVDLPLSTAPPSSHEPGGGQPSAAPVGTPPAVFDAGKLSDADWRKHKRSMGITG